MGRHHLDDMPADRRMQRLEADMADLQASFDALRAKVEAAAAAQALATNAAEAEMAAKLDELAAYVDANFLVSAGDAALLGDTPAEASLVADPAQEESHGWRPGQ